MTSVQAGSVQARPDDLLARTAALCAGAVDVLEVAAGLEADGIGDDKAREYGHADVFALAEYLFRQTPRRPPAMDQTPEDPWQAEPWRHLLRGALFGLPGVCYASATPLLVRGASVGLMLACLIMTWPVSQGIAYLGYLRLGQARRPSARRALRLGTAVAAAVLLPVLVAAGITLHTGPLAIALAAGQCAYLLAATVALVLGAEIWLLLALLPGVVTGGAWMLLGHGALPPAAWSAWGVTLAATVALALWRTAGSEPARLTRGDLLAALPHAFFGLLAAGLLTLPVVGEVAERELPAAATTVTVLALSLSMGVAEWVLYVHRRRVHRLLWASIELRSFRLDASGELVAAVVVYLSALTVLIVAVGGLSGLAWTPETLRTTVGQVALGGVFFVALLLQSCGHLKAVLVALVPALVIEIAGLATTSPGLARAAVSELLFFSLLTYGCVVLSRATSHR